MKKYLGIVCSIFLVMALCGCADVAEKEEIGASQLETSLEGSENHVETASYEMMGMTFDLPTSWSLLDSCLEEYEAGEGLICFVSDSDEWARILLHAEVIPDIMKLDVGGDSVVMDSKEGVAEYWSTLGGNDTTVMKEGFWGITSNGIEYYEALTTSEGQVADRDPEQRSSRIIVVPINENEAVLCFSTSVPEAEAEKYNGDLDIVLNSLKFK